MVVLAVPAHKTHGNCLSLRLSVSALEPYNLISGNAPLRLDTKKTT